MELDHSLIEKMQPVCDAIIIYLNYSFSPTQQLPICKPPSHSSMVTVYYASCFDGHVYTTKSIKDRSWLLKSFVSTIILKVD